MLVHLRDTEAEGPDRNGHAEFNVAREKMSFRTRWCHKLKSSKKQLSKLTDVG